MRRAHLKSALAALLLISAAIACGERSSSVRGDLTGVELLVSYDPGAGLEQLLVSGSLPGGGAAFVPGLVPEQPQPLVDGSDSVVILLPDSMGGMTLSLHVDGLVSGSAALAGDSIVVLETENLVDAGMSLSAITPTPTPSGAACSNTIDDDGDGQVDFPNDPGCLTADDTDERGTAVCDDGIDQDGDTYADFPADPGCTNINDASELGPPSRECDNGNDDDDVDLFIDYPDDPECSGPEDTSED